MEQVAVNHGIRLSCAESWISSENQVSTMAADTLAPCIAKPPSS